MIRDLLEELRKKREEEDEARNLIEEMQRNLDEAQHESFEVERKAGPCSLGTHRCFRQGTRAKLADDAEQRHEEPEQGQGPL